LVALVVVVVVGIVLLVVLRPMVVVLVEIQPLRLEQPIQEVVEAVAVLEMRLEQLVVQV
jgi:hypothetical protein